jgi:glycosyltransferase involved in cell wall biosynthesis
MKMRANVRDKPADLRMTARRESRKPTRGKKPKILQLCAVDFTVHHFVLPLGRKLRDEYEVHFASSAGPYVEGIRREGFRYHCIPIARSYNVASHVRAVFLLRRLIARERFEIVHTHTPIASLIGRLAARLANVPITLYTAHGFYFHDRMPPLKRRLFIMLEKFGGYLTDYTFTVSGEDRDAAVALGISDLERVLHIGNGVNLNRFDPDRLRSERDAVRESLGIAPNQPVVCITGRLVREKGYLELIDAFARVVRRIPEAVLLCIGGALESDHDDASDEIAARVQAHGLSEQVRFLAFRADVERVLCASDVFALPSHREGMPISILEAMAMGLPVVATNIRGSREAVKEGVSGVLVEVGDVEGLAASLTELLSDPAGRASMGRHAQHIAKNEFNENDIFEKQLAVLERLLGEKDLRGG